MKIFITGGGGYVGTACANFFREQGHTVSCFDRKPPGEWLVPMGPGDRVCDVGTSLFGAYLDGVKPDVVVHLAAHTAPASVSTGYEDNVVLAARVIEHTHAAGVKRFVFASSAAVYPDSTNPVSEHDAMAPVTLYGRTKASAERIMFGMANWFGMEFTALRYFNICGGRVPVHSRALIPAAVKAAITGRPLHVYGYHHVRDFIHVHNVAQATLAACLNPQGCPVNVGTGIPTRVDAVIKLVEKFTDCKITCMDAKPSVQLAHSVADTCRLSELMPEGMERLALEHAIEDTIVSLKRGVVTE